MKTPKLEKNDEGRYTGSLTDQMSLDAEQKKQIRRVLAGSETPLHLSEIAAKAGIDLTAAPRQQAMANFLEVYLVSTKECELAFAPSARRGQDKFIGWRGTGHLRDLINRGLA